MLEIDSSMSQNISKAQGHKSIMDAHNLWAQRQNFIKRYDMILSLKSLHVLRNTSSLSLNTARHAKLYHAMKKPYVNLTQKCCRLLRAKVHFK